MQFRQARADMHLQIGGTWHCRGRGGRVSIARFFYRTRSVIDHASYLIRLTKRTCVRTSDIDRNLRFRARCESDVTP